MDLFEFREQQGRLLGVEPTILGSPQWKNYSVQFCMGWYNTHTISKSTGGVRYIEAPVDELKSLQRNLLEEAQELEVSEFAYGLGEKDYVANAKQHEGRKHILRIDLKEFYRSTTLKRVMKVMPQGPAREWILKHAIYIFYTFERSKDGSQHTYLATGSPLSPYVSNLIVKALDDDISEMATKHGVTYTRYLDDIVFSTDEISKEDKWGLFKEVCERVTKDGWTINHKKSKWLNPHQDAMVVTGVDVRDAPKITRRYITNEIKPLLNNLARDICQASPYTLNFVYKGSASDGIRLPHALQWLNVKSVEGFLRRIPAAHAGQLNYIHQVSPLQYQKLVQHFIDRVNKQMKYHSVLDIEAKVSVWARDCLNSSIPMEHFPAGAARTTEVEKFSLAIIDRYAKILKETNLPEPIALLIAGIEIWSKENTDGSARKANPGSRQEHAAV